MNDRYRDEHAPIPPTIRQYTEAERLAYAREGAKNIRVDTPGAMVQVAVDVLMRHLREHQNNIVMTAEPDGLMILAKGGAMKQLIQLLATMGPTP